MKRAPILLFADYLTSMGESLSSSLENGLPTWTLESIS